MRVDAASLPNAAQTHSRVHGGSRQLPEKAAEKASANALANFPSTEQLAGSTTETADAAAKIAPRGLENALSQHEAKTRDNPGLANALEMLQRNLSRYSVEPPPAAPTPETPANSETGTEPA